MAHQTCLAPSQMRDVATSEIFSLKRELKARCPRAFWIQGLRSARRYAIEFEGILNGRDRIGDNFENAYLRYFLQNENIQIFLGRSQQTARWDIVLKGRNSLQQLRVLR